MVVDEHFVPKLGLDLAPYLQRQDRTASHHLLRYQWATAVIADLKPENSILDVACGAGYGSYMIARQTPASTVLGVDYDKKAVDFATRHYVQPTLAYRQGDVLRWQETIGPDQFDCIVSFDTLEHCPHREIMMEHLVAHLKPEGILLLSTPCGHDENQLQPRWFHHAIEYSTASLYDFLTRYFGTILRPEEADFPHLAVFDQLQGSGVTYNLRLNPVICRNPIVRPNPYR